jgi:hypothetical protein
MSKMRRNPHETCQRRVRSILAVGSLDPQVGNRDHTAARAETMGFARAFRTADLRTGFTLRPKGTFASIAPLGISAVPAVLEVCPTSRAERLVCAVVPHKVCSSSLPSFLLCGSGFPSVERGQCPRTGLCWFGDEQ